MITDWLMVIITTIYVIATIMICYFNGKSAKAAKSQTEEMIRQYDLANRPNVTIHFDIIRSGLLCFVVENEGNMPAHDVNIRINQEFINGIENDIDKERLKRFAESKLYLTSRQRVFMLLGGQPEFQQLAKNVAEIDISYDSYEEHTTIDLNQYAMLLVYDSPVEDMAQHLKKIKENEERFHKKVLKQMENKKPVSHVVIHDSTVEEAHKYRIYKYLCCEGKHTTVAIADELKMDKDYVLGLLIELLRVDKLIGFYQDDENNDDKVVWYRC